MLRFPVEIMIKIKTVDELESILQQTAEIIKNNPDITVKTIIEIDLDDHIHKRRQTKTDISPFELMRAALKESLCRVPELHSIGIEVPKRF